MHTCCVCGWKWKSADRETEKAVIEAAKANKSGPYCALCFHLEFAERYAKQRGYDSLRKVLDERGR